MKQGDPTKIKKGLGEKFRAKILKMLDPTTLGDCPICMVTFEKGDKVMDLPCHIQHLVHDVCFNQFVEFQKKNGREALCPECRAKIDEEKCRVVTL